MKYLADDPPACVICGSLMEWEDCCNCEDGYNDLYDEDPLWYDEDDIEECSTCNGESGWWYCPNARSHVEVFGTKFVAPSQIGGFSYETQTSA